MQTEIVTALIAAGGSCLGTIVGIMANTRLVEYRIKQLEKKVEKHNQVIERTFVLEEKMKVANHRIDDLEKEN